MHLTFNKIQLTKLVSRRRTAHKSFQDIFAIEMFSRDMHALNDVTSEFL
jgi:hypothetical protein